MMKLRAVILCLGIAAAAFGQQAAVTNAPPKPRWDATAHLGLTLTRGNTRTLLVAGDVAATRKWEHNELVLGADVAYGEDRGIKNTEGYHGFAQYNRLFTERLFGYLRVEGLHDGIADINYRITVSPGLGYYFVKNATTSLSGQVGPGYVFEEIGDVRNDYATVRFAERFDHRLNEHVKIWQSLEFLPQVDKWGNYVINAELGVETALTKKFTQRVTISDTYRSEPAADREKNDIRLIAAIGYKF